MYSLNLDYLFNRVYDALLWIKYTWLFTLLRTNPDTYLDEVSYRSWDGLRDRGWFDSYLALKNGTGTPEVHLSLWQRIAEAFGYKLPDSDGDGIPDVSDPSPYDPNNLTAAQLKERYQQDYSFTDTVRNIFGIGPKDTDKDGVPDSYEVAHSMNPNDPDTDHDGMLDGQELTKGTDPLNPDTDGDLVIDGRDEAPLDPHVSSLGTDTDGDGVSDRVEKILGTDIHKVDTDGDGIPDNMDTYPLDPQNLSQLPSLDFAKHAEGLHFSIQNPILSFITDLLGLASIAVILLLVYVVSRWFIVFIEALGHYDHHFHHDDGHSSKSGAHIITDSRSSHDDMPAGIPGLPIFEEAPAQPPTPEAFNDHPRFAVIQGYMSSQSEALWRIGIMEADNLLQEVLQDKGYSGVGVGEMLQNASFKTIDLAWDAHKIRNRIAHEGSDFQLTEREAKRAFTLYESVFRELKAII
jgi:hypothetical protein